jgi:hypothetical protein
MFAPKCYKVKSPKDRKKGGVYTVEFPLPACMVRTFCSDKWVKDTSDKYVKKIKFSLQKTDSNVEGQPIMVFVISGKHKQSVIDVGYAAAERYNKIVAVVKKIKSSSEE